MTIPTGPEKCAELAYTGRFDELPIDELPNPMTVDEAAAVARRSRATIARACQKGRIKAVSFGGKWNINRNSLLEYAGLE